MIDDKKQKNQFGVNTDTNYKHLSYTEVIPILSEGIKQMVNENKNKITTKQLCINNTCVNEDEIRFLKQLYNQR